MSVEKQSFRIKQRRYVKDLHRKAMEGDGNALEELSSIALGGNVSARRFIRRQERLGPFPIRTVEKN